MSDNAPFTLIRAGFALPGARYALLSRRPLPKGEGFFIYRLPNLTLLLDSECFASGWFVSYLREELKWPMAAARAESP